MTSLDLSNGRLINVGWQHHRRSPSTIESSVVHVVDYRPLPPTYRCTRLAGWTTSMVLPRKEWTENAGYESPIVELQTCLVSTLDPHYSLRLKLGRPPDDRIYTCPVFMSTSRSNRLPETSNSHSISMPGKPKRSLSKSFVPGDKTCRLNLAVNVFPRDVCHGCVERREVCILLMMVA